MTSMVGRRRFLSLAAGGLAASGLALRTMPRPVSSRGLQAIAFDGFAVFDPRPIAMLTERLFPGRGAELGSLWRARQFEYQWLRALSGRYADFVQCTEEALVFAARSLRLECGAGKRDELMQAYFDLKAWPDALLSLESLKRAGIRPALLSNMTPGMLKAAVGKSGLAATFEHILSTHDVRSFKPDPRAYQMAIDAFRLERHAVLFVAFAGWDAGGAKWFGYPTFWVNRLGQVGEELGASADGVGRDFQDLIRFVLDDARSPEKGIGAIGGSGRRR